MFFITPTDKIKYTFPLFAFAFLLILSFSTSPLYDFMGTDSGIFQTMGLGLLEGKLPYRDLFDHKGFYLWVIQAVGYWLGYRTGLFCLQVVSLTATLYIWRKIATLFVSREWANIAAILTLLPLGVFILDGNHCEEWMLPYLSIPYYFALKYLLRTPDRVHPVKYSVIYGICFALVFHIRVNDAFAQCGGVIFGIFLYLCFKKQFSNAAVHALASLGAFIIVSLPFVGYYLYHDAWGDFIYGNFTFSFMYAHIGGFVHRVFSSTSIGYVIVPLLIIVFYAIVYYNKKIWWVLLPCVMLSYFALGPYAHDRYPLISLVALLSVGMGMLMGCIGVHQHKVVKDSFLLLFLVYLIPYVMLTVSFPVRDAYKLYTSPYPKRFYAETDKLLAHIPENERNSVWNYSLGYDSYIDNREECQSAYNSIFVHKHFTQCNLVILSHHPITDPNLRKRDEQLYMKIKPKWIVTCVHPNFDVNIGVIKEDLKTKYKLVAQTDTTLCDIILYKRVKK